MRLNVASRVRAAEKGSVRIMDKGQEGHFLVEEPQVLDSLQALNYNMFKNILMKAGRAMKQALTVGVIISTTFKIRNLAQDVVSAIATNEVSYNPRVSLARRWATRRSGSSTWCVDISVGSAAKP